MSPLAPKNTLASSSAVAHWPAARPAPMQIARRCSRPPGSRGRHRQTARRWAAPGSRAASAPATPPPAAVRSPEPLPRPSSPGRAPGRASRRQTRPGPGTPPPAMGRRRGCGSRRRTIGPEGLSNRAFHDCIRSGFALRYACLQCASSPDSRSRTLQAPPALPPGPPATGCAKPSSTCSRRASRAQRFWICMPARVRWESKRSAAAPQAWNSWSKPRTRCWCLEKSGQLGSVPRTDSFRIHNRSAAAFLRLLKPGSKPDSNEGSKRRAKPEAEPIAIQAAGFNIVFLDPPYDADREYSATLGLLGGDSVPSARAGCNRDRRASPQAGASNPIRTAQPHAAPGTRRCSIELLRGCGTAGPLAGTETG